MKITWSILALAALVSVGCNETHHARVHEANGLREGAPVATSGVPVGHVDSLHVVEGEVDVEFTIESEHQITFRHDSCVRVARADGQPPTLELVPGTGAPLTEAQPLPECEPEALEVGALMEELGEGVSQLLQQFGRGILGRNDPSTTQQGGGSNTPGPSLPSLPFPGLPSIGSPRDPEPSACTSLEVRVARTELLDPSPMALPNGGQRATLSIENRGTEAVTISAVADAIFVTQDRHMLSVAMQPASTNAWFMPFEIAASATATVTVTFEGQSPSSLDEVEIRGVSEVATPFETCTLHATGLAGR